MGISGMEDGRPLDLKPGDFNETFELRALLAETYESCSSLSLWMECLESLRLKMPMVAGEGREGSPGESNRTDEKVVEVRETKNKRETPSRRPNKLKKTTRSPAKG